MHRQDDINKIQRCSNDSNEKYMFMKNTHMSISKRCMNEISSINRGRYNLYDNGRNILNDDMVCIYNIRENI